MQKIRPLILVAAMLVAGSASAASVSISIDNVVSSYTLGSLSVDSAGNATVSATSNGTPPASEYTVTINQSTGGTVSGTSGVTPAGTTGSWSAVADTTNGYVFSSWGGICVGTVGTSCSKTVNGPSVVSATFALAAGGGAPLVDSNCPAVDPAKVTVVNTSVSAKLYPRTDNPSVAPEHIYAYRFTTQDAASVGSWVATAMTSATNGKLVKITQCAGVLEPTNTVGACERSTVESTRVDYVVDRPDLATRSYCHLQPNTVYYANVVSKSKLTDTTYNCGTTATATATSKCAFSMSGN
jgi:hypothetical protein